MTTYKFIKFKNGISSFAELTVELADGNLSEIEWADQVAKYASIYGDAVKGGMEDALRWHIEDGGNAAAFRVVGLTELLVDTKPDAVRCAATVATWKALGHDENALRFVYQDEWRTLRER